MNPSRLGLEKPRSPERRAALFAIAIGSAACVFLYTAARTVDAQGADAPPASRGSLSAWVGKLAVNGTTEAAAVFARAPTGRDTRPRPHAAAVAEPTRREDLSFSLPSHAQFSDEIAARRGLAELEIADAARAERASVLADRCASSCEEAAQALESQGAFVRGRLDSGRAQLVSRTESVSRVERTLDFIEE